LANCTGIRRCPCSTKTIATVSITNINSRTTIAPVPASAFTRVTVEGYELTTEVKIRIDMPLPMPRWVMSSPIHMMSAVPAVSVRTMSRMRGMVKSGTRSRFVETLAKKPPPPLWNRKTRPVDCMIAMPTVT
jgi:hypothetical protein